MRGSGGGRISKPLVEDEPLDLAPYFGDRCPLPTAVLPTPNGTSSQAHLLPGALRRGVGVGT